MRHSRMTAVGLALALGFSLFLPAVPSFAVTCGTHASIFVQMGPGSEHGRGDAGWLFIKNRDLGLQCNDSDSLSTVNIHNDGFTRWVEIGWNQQWDCYSCDPKTKKYNVFIESKSDGGVGMGHIENGPAIPDSDVGTWDRFKVNNQAGSTVWDFWWMQDADNGTYRLICNGLPSSCDWDAGFQGGYIFGETEQWPKNGGTGAWSHFQNLRYKDCSSSCTWKPWAYSLDPNGSNQLGFDGIDGWEYDGGGPATDEYEILQCTSPC